MKKKQFYESPEAEMLVVRFEQNMMASDFETQQLQEGNSSWWVDDDNE